jgi:hypothetical protein
MKPGPDDLAPNVALVSRRFNEVNQAKFFEKRNSFSSSLDVSSCYNRNPISINCEWSCSMHRKMGYEIFHINFLWNNIFSGTVADICRYLRNFNGVLQIMAAFVNSSIYRLKQTWDRISKQNKQVINKLQSLVHSDGKFKNLRDTLTK